MTGVRRNVTVCVLPIDNNEILLVKNRKEIKRIPGKEPFKRESKWGMPRGRMEPQDKDEVATGKREGQEETGYEMKIDERYRVGEPAGDHTMVAFIGCPVAGHLEINNEEIIDARWFPIRSLWTRDPSHPDYVDMHPRQRRMAQQLIKLWQRLGR